MKKLFEENLVANWGKDEAIQFIQEITKLKEWKVDDVPTFAKKTSDEVIDEVKKIVSDKFITKIDVTEKSGSWNVINIYFENIKLLYFIKKEPLFSQVLMKLGKNDAGEQFHLSRFLTQFFLPLFTDWSPTATVSESEFLKLLTKLSDFDALKKKFDDLQLKEVTKESIVQFFSETIPEMEKSNLVFSIDSLNFTRPYKDNFVWTDSKDPNDTMVVFLKCRYPNLTEETMFDLRFYIANCKDGFLVLDECDNFIPQLLEGAEIAYRFS